MTVIWKMGPSESHGVLFLSWHQHCIQRPLLLNVPYLTVFIEPHFETTHCTFSSIKLQFLTNEPFNVIWRFIFDPYICTGEFIDNMVSQEKVIPGPLTLPSSYQWVWFSNVETFIIRHSGIAFEAILASVLLLGNLQIIIFDVLKPPHPQWQHRHPNPHSTPSPSTPTHYQSQGVCFLWAGNYFTTQQPTSTLFGPLRR